MKPMDLLKSVKILKNIEEIQQYKMDFTEDVLLILDMNLQIMKKFLLSQP